MQKHVDRCGLLKRILNCITVSAILIEHINVKTDDLSDFTA